MASQYRKRRQAARLLAVFICAFFIAALVLASAFIVAHVNHEHDANGAEGACAACAHICAAEKLLRMVSVAFIFSVAEIGAIFFALRLLKTLRLNIAASTLISVKIRLNN
jgi:hypothetical protein